MPNLVPGWRNISFRKICTSVRPVRAVQRRQTGPKSTIGARSCILRFVKVSTPNGYRPPHPRNIKCYDRLMRHIQWNKSTLHLLFTSPNPILSNLDMTCYSSIDLYGHRRRPKPAGQPKVYPATFTPWQGQSRMRVSTTFASLFVNQSFFVT